MRLKSLPLFLIGNRDAILDLASSRWTLLVGFLFVLSASLARNYDGAALLLEPAVLTHGLLASVGNALVLFTLIYMVAMMRLKHTPDGYAPSFLSGYLSFLGLFWMTAPMGWLYGIPYERMFDRPVAAVEANLWTLALVSIWRVALITRVLAVLWRTPTGSVLFIVLLFADVVVLIAANTMTTPLINFMGGLQHTEEDALIAGLTLALMFWSFLLAIPMLIAAAISVRWFRPRWFVPAAAPGAGASRGMIGLACAAILMWLPPMIITQPEQHHRHRAESLLRAGDIETAFAEMSTRDRRHHPPIWDPPPRLGYGEMNPPMADIVRALRAQPFAPWVRDLYLPKVSVYVRSVGSMYMTYSRFEDLAAYVISSYDRCPDEDKSLQTLIAKRDAIRLLLDQDPALARSERDALHRLLSFIDERAARRTAPPDGASDTP